MQFWKDAMKGIADVRWVHLTNKGLRAHRRRAAGQSAEASHRSRFTPGIFSYKIPFISPKKDHRGQGEYTLKFCGDS